MEVRVVSTIDCPRCSYSAEHHTDVCHRCNGAGEIEIDEEENDDAE